MGAEFGVAKASKRLRTAAETIEATGWWTVVRPGLRWDMRKVSSKPMMEMSSGTDSHMEVIVRIAPSACRSDPVMIAVTPRSISPAVWAAAASYV